MDYVSIGAQTRAVTPETNPPSIAEAKFNNPRGGGVLRIIRSVKSVSFL